MTDAAQDSAAKAEDEVSSASAMASENVNTVAAATEELSPPQSARNRACRFRRPRVNARETAA